MTCMMSMYLSILRVIWRHLTAFETGSVTLLERKSSRKLAPMRASTLATMYTMMSLKMV